MGKRLDEEEKQLVASILRREYKDKMGHPVVYVVDREQMGSAELWQNKGGAAIKTASEAAGQSRA